MNSSMLRVMLFTLLTASGFWLVENVSVRAQEEGAVAVEPNIENAGGETTTKKATSDKSLGGMIADSGLVGIAFYALLGLFSVFGLTVSLERIFNLNRNKIIPPAFEGTLRELVNRPGASVEDYRRACATPSPISNVLSSAVKRAGRPLPEVEKAMEDTVAREMATLRGKHRALSVIGNVAPLVGLLGTVVGIIFAFQTASTEGVGKGEALSEGISLALMTTAVGLTIAIPALILVAWFNAKCERYMRDCDMLLLDTLPSFSRWEHQEVSEYAVNQPQRAEEPVGAG